ncbi:hypothetical protein K439DRAFT_757446 [Ramaria rubella]|nr:hypothetical protein K439DRAFT_757446 [Ramaria rubella]
MSTLSQNGLETTRKVMDRSALNTPIVKGLPESFSNLDAAILLHVIIQDSPHCVFAKEFTILKPTYSLAKT